MAEIIRVKFGAPEIIRVKMVNNHGSSASIKDHSDVSNINPINGQVLKWNNITGKYEPSSDIFEQFHFDDDYECWI